MINTMPSIVTSFNPFLYSLRSPYVGLKFHRCSNGCHLHRHLTALPCASCPAKYWRYVMWGLPSNYLSLFYRYAPTATQYVFRRYLSGPAPAFPTTIARSYSPSVGRSFEASHLFKRHKTR
jgi:hypothetical protein